MNNLSDYSRFIDQTILSPTVTDADFQLFLEESIPYKFASLCVSPHRVSSVKNRFPDQCITTVIGFPLGTSTTKVKLYETQVALDDGADEIDMVINQGEFKSGNFKPLLKEIDQIKKVCDNRILKIIVETANLNEKEKIDICKLILESSSDYIKTSTGFASKGAEISDIKLFYSIMSAKKKIKASGGIKSADSFVKFIEAGADRIGTSSGISILKELKAV